MLSKQFEFKKNGGYVVKYCSNWSSIVQTYKKVENWSKIYRVQVGNGLLLFNTCRVVVQTIFNSKNKGRVHISTVE